MLCWGSHLAELALPVLHPLCLINDDVLPLKLAQLVPAQTSVTANAGRVSLTHGYGVTAGITNLTLQNMLLLRLTAAAWKPA